MPYLRQEVFPQQVDHHYTWRQRLIRITAQLRGSHSEVQIHLLHPIEEEEHILGLVSLPTQQGVVPQVEVLPAHQGP